ncbi:hypothetical protein HY844_01790 [Candidatus Berkelbacteria bacterium]|nr:hypothetical protein [Candidatus Berkelbacteria bacterium]
MIVQGVVEGRLPVPGVEKLHWELSQKIADLEIDGITTLMNRDGISVFVRIPEELKDLDARNKPSRLTIILGYKDGKWGVKRDAKVSDRHMRFRSHYTGIDRLVRVLADHQICTNLRLMLGDA